MLKIYAVTYGTRQLVTQAPNPAEAVRKVALLYYAQVERLVEYTRRPDGAITFRAMIDAELDIFLTVRRVHFTEGILSYQIGEYKDRPVEFGG